MLLDIDMSLSQCFRLLNMGLMNTDLSSGVNIFFFFFWSYFSKCI